MKKRSKTDPSTSAAPASAEARHVLFPVVAIGASAGGLDPIVAFLAAMPSDSGVAVVVIQHLDPNYKSMLPELLGRATRIPVFEIADRMPLGPDAVYVIPPNADLGVADGILRLSEPAEARGHRLPIDHFFSALAAELGELAVGVVFSGMGTDGTRGLQAIKAANGLTLAQFPDSARFECMPCSAIAAEAVDLVELPENMPAKILAYLSHRTLLGRRERLADARDGLQEIMRLLGEHTGNSFADYKVSTVLRRIERRMSLHQFGALEQYAALLRDNPHEIDLLFKELLIGVTSFFRDQKVWEYLKVEVLPQLFAANPAGAALKAWVAACSTGEEAYSLAMVFAEAAAAADPPGKYTLQIFATDLSDDAIERARAGRFSHGIASDVSAERLARFFVEEESGYCVRKEIRNMIIFAQQNIISDPPFTKLDILCCRNLLIYLNAKLQQRLIPLFHYALKRGGILLLGSADTTGYASELFAPLATATRLFRRLDSDTVRCVPAYFPTKVAAAHPNPVELREAAMPGKIQTHVEQLLLQKYTPAAALLNHDGDILYINGRTGAFLEPAAGKANWNIHAMAREGLRYELLGLIKQAMLGVGVMRLKGLLFSDANGQTQCVDLSAEALSEPEALAGMVFVTFAGAPAPPVTTGSRRSPHPKVAELEQQLAQARAEIRAVRDEMQTSREELRSANEELQSTNEELQSTNEELTTSKEEMQSLNEELYTVNAELQSKVDDLSLVNSDMKNLLNSTEIATIFLDGALRIRRFTAPATQIYKLIATDLRRPLSDIVNDLDYPDLEADALGVIRTLVFSERQIPTRDGRWYNVRIMPYRTVDNVIDGVVVTFINITEAKLLEAQLRRIQGSALAVAEGGS